MVVRVRIAGQALKSGPQLTGVSVEDLDELESFIRSRREPYNPQFLLFHRARLLVDEPLLLLDRERLFLDQPLLLLHRACLHVNQPLLLLDRSPLLLDKAETFIRGHDQVRDLLLFLFNRTGLLNNDC